MTAHTDGVALLAKVSRAMQRGTIGAGLIVTRRGAEVELSMPHSYDVRAEQELADRTLAWATSTFGAGRRVVRSGVVKRRNPVHGRRPAQLPFNVCEDTFHTQRALLRIVHLVAHEHHPDTVKATVLRGGALSFHCWGCQRPLSLTQTRALGVKV